MAEKDGEEKTSAEDQEEDKEQEDDPFADIFDNDDKEEDKDESSEEDTAKDKKKTPDKKSTQKVVKKVDEIVDERITSAEQRLERRADVADYIASDAGKIFSKFATEIRKAALDPRFSSIPVSQLPGVILKPSAYSKALDDARAEADNEAADSVTGGNTSRSTTPEELQKIDPTTMSKEEFAKLKNDALAGKYKIKK